jgi:hypothetical protein
MNDDNRSKSDSMNFYVTNNQPSDTANWHHPQHLPVHHCLHVKQWKCYTMWW